MDPITIPLKGHIDSNNASEVERDILARLIDTGHAPIVLDASALHYISSAGLRILLRLRKTNPDITLTEVSSEIYEILEMTGFTEILNVEKAYRRISLEGCEVIGEGANGRVYRIGHDTVVKTYKNADALSEIQHEREVARTALILGIPTAISYDVVRVGESYGAVFELLNATSFSKILAEQPERIDWCVEEYVKLLKQIHATAVPEGKLPPAINKVRGWVKGVLPVIPSDLGEKLACMVEALPARNTMLHGDYHTKNIVLADGEVLLIDMDTLSVGHPIFEFVQIFNSYIGFGEYDPEIIARFQGFSADTARTFWSRSLRMYLDADDERMLDAERKIRCLSYVRLIDWSLRHRSFGSDKNRASRELWTRNLIELLSSLDSLDFDLEAPAKGTCTELEPDCVVENPPKVQSFTARSLTAVHFPKIDLHMHTTVSDGTDTPEEIIGQVRRKGIELFAVTDHDAMLGCEIIRDRRSEDDPKFITGVEFSCKDEEGKYHILGYNYRTDSPEMRALVDRGHRTRMEKAKLRLDFLRSEFGITFPDEEIQRLLSLNNPGKPHIGNLMVRCGYAASKEIAIKDYINKIRLNSDYIRPEEAIAAILAGGGIPVLAHPSFGDGSQLITGRDMERRIEKLIGFGLKGIEGYYSNFTDALRDEILGFAEQFDLYVTAGSDYHGMNKSIPLGTTGLDSSMTCAKGLLRFLEDTVGLD